ncbi:hypothetical protein QLQ80_01520 [Mycoplasma sp. M5725]|uniref:Uncharacterized protein n=1 Tax=Mycoplasma phocimorsus TaxID=3045839 RepID=A0AAJ1PR21_9MOLU|nr:hypothetical protein [Mycoplasma phocimorsus]MDJ1645767.1 hypothetical protein [Mycoplasma phocimorsus]
MPNSSLWLLKTPKSKKTGISSNIFSGWGLKEYLFGGFLSLFGLGALTGIGYGIYKGAEEIKKRITENYQKRLEKSKNYELTLKIKKEEYKSKSWSIYALGTGLEGGVIGTFDKNVPNDKKNANFSNKGDGNFTIKIENIINLEKVLITLKVDNVGAENQTLPFYFNNSNNEKEIYLLSDYYEIDAKTNPPTKKRNPIPLGTVTFTKVI